MLLSLCYALFNSGKIKIPSLYTQRCAHFYPICILSRQLQIMTESLPLVLECDVLVEKHSHIQHVTLNRPQTLNAINLSMVRDLTAKLMIWRNDPQTSVITLKGAGEKAFCAGGDLKSITFSAREGGNYGQQFFKEEFTLNYIIGTYPKPLISILNGITFGGAAGLSVIGRFCVSTERSVFSMPECAIGLFPDVGSGYYLSRLPGNIGLFLGMTGHRLKGRDIQHVGLASHYIDYNQITLLEKNLENLSHPVTAEEVNNVLNEFQRKSDTNFTERFSLEQHKEQISKCFSGGSVEEIVESLRLDGSEWALKQLEHIKKMSPTSLKITFRLLKEGLKKTLAETLCTEYRLTQRCVADKDFHEGIRAAILDKDQSPRWEPATLEEVSQERIDYYFSPMGEEQELSLTKFVS